VLFSVVSKEVQMERFEVGAAEAQLRRRTAHEALDLRNSITFTSLSAAVSAPLRQF
jgi:hypothetical protein